MKKIFAFIMTFVMAFMLVGCKKTPELSFEEVSYNLNVGDTITLKPTILNLEGNDLVSYKVIGDGIIKLEGSKVIALKEGSATIEASLKDYEKVPSVTLTIKVNKVNVTDIIISGPTKVRKGNSIELKAKTVPDNVTYNEVTWKSLDETKATIDKDGKVTALDLGKVKIEATIDGFKKTIEIEVIRPLATDIELTGNNKMIIGEEQTLIVKLTPEDAEKEVTFESNNKSIATVDETGKVKALKDGTVIIKVTMGSLVSEFEIEVGKKEAEKITIEGAKELLAGETLQLKAIVEPNDAEQAVSWSSSNATIATVDENGLVTTLKGGTVTIKALAPNNVEASVELVIKEYNKEVIIVDETFEDGAEFKEGEIDYKVGFNAFKTLKGALENAIDGARIVVRKGTYLDDATVKNTVTIEGPNKDYEGLSESPRKEEAIIGGIITLDGVKDVKINGFKFTGKGQILSTGAKLENIEISSLLVTEKGEATSVWDENQRNYDPTAFITLVSGSNENLHKGIIIKECMFDIRDGAIKLGRVEDITIENNYFSNFERDAIRFPGGYNGGTIQILGNCFLNDDMQGYNAIFLASYGDAEGKAPVTVIVKDNWFDNIGTIKEGVTYTGALSAKTYQELGANFIIEGNEFERLANVFRIRNNATEANHKDTPWEFIARHNTFTCVPEGVYYDNRVTAGDNDTTAPAKAIFDKNIFYDVNDNIIEPDMNKLLHVKEVTNSFKSESDFLKDLYGVYHDFNIVVNPDFKDIPAGSIIAVMDKNIKIGETAFASITEALAIAKDGDIIYLMPGTYAEDITLSNGITLFGPLGEYKAVYSGKVTIASSNVTIEGIRFENDCEINLEKAEGILENIKINKNTFIDPKSSVDAFIAINTETHNFEFSYNTVSNPRKPRFIRGYQPVYDLTMIGNELGGSQALFDYVRMDKGFGGNVVVKNNTFGTTQQSGFMIMFHMPGDFVFMDNKFIDQQNVAIDIRSLTGEYTNPKGSLTIIHNVFDRSSFTGTPWGCIRIRYKGYNEGDIKVDVNYNTFINWGMEDIVQDAGNTPYGKPLVNADNNYFEGITAENIEANAAKLLGGFGLSWKNPFETKEALEEAYKLLTDEIIVTIPEEALIEGKEIQVTVKATPETAKQEFEYIVLDEEIISCTETGMVKGIKAGVGTLRIKALDGSGKFIDVEINVLPFEGIKIGEKEYANLNDAILEAKIDDVIMLHGVDLIGDFTIPKSVTIDGLGNPDKMSIIVGKITMLGNSILKNVKMEGKSSIELKDAGLSENNAIIGCVFDNVISPVDAFISINTEATNFVFSNNTAINPRKPRFIRAYQNVNGFTMENNNLGDSKDLVFDYIRFDKALGGEVKIIGNYVGQNSQSGFRIASHLPGNFVVKNNIIHGSKNTSFDLRANGSVTDADKITILFENNTFTHEGWTPDVIWGCIRLSFTGYKEENVSVIAKYNKFFGWGEVDVIENNSKDAFKGVILEADYNYFEGITAATIEEKKAKLFGGMAKSTANTFDTPEALDEAYKALPKE